MVTLFYGPWNLTFRRINPNHPKHRLVIGEADTPGVYEWERGDDLISVEVTGAMWSAAIDTLIDGVWTPCRLQRTMAYEPPDGIVVSLVGYTGDREDVTQPNIVRCVYRDPERNPPDVPDDFDFTYPEGAERRAEPHRHPSPGG